MTKTLAAIIVAALALSGLRADDPVAKGFVLPAHLAPAANDDDIRKLKIEHANKLLDVLRQYQVREEGGVFSGPQELPTFLDTQRRALDARLALEATPTGKRKTLELFLGYALQTQRMMGQRRPVDSPTLMPMAEAYKLEVEIRLAEFKKAAGK